MKHLIFTLVILSLISTSAFSQKVKYKDLFVFLKAENYRDGENYLRTFLVSNPEHPNATFQMGKMLQLQIDTVDLLSNSIRALELADSSILYLNKSLSLITEKYVVKQHDDDYYADFRRRNLRTGKFEVKLSDVQLDIETRIKSISEFSSGLKKFKMHVNTATSYYDSCLTYFGSLAAKADNITKLYFTAGPEDQQLLRRLTTHYDSTLYNFNTGRAIMQGLGKSAIKQDLIERVIENYPGDYNKKPNFFATTVEVFNFKLWANGTNDKILKQILPLKKRIVKFDQKLSELHDRIIRDSLDSRSEIFKLATENVAKDIDLYHVNSFPSAIYNYRIAEINYHSAVNYWYSNVADTVNVGVKLNLLADFEKQFSGISQLLGILEESNNSTERLIFHDYITEIYTDNSGVEVFIAGQKDEVQYDGEMLAEWQLKVGEEDKRTLWHQDSISLLTGVEIINSDYSKYSTVMIDSLGDRDLGFYSLREDISTISLTFGVSPSSRVLDTLYSIAIDPFLVEQRLINLNYLADSLGVNKRIWVLNSRIPNKKSKFKTQVFLTNPYEGTAWEKTFDLAMAPREILIDDEKQVIKIVGDNDEILLALDASGKTVVLDGGDD